MFGWRQNVNAVCCFSACECGVGLGLVLAVCTTLRVHAVTYILFIDRCIRGEWNGNLADSTKELAASWFAGKFSTTKIQLRYPKAYGMAADFGIHDDSFAFSTLDGDANGGVEKGWFTWPRVVELGATDFWERAPMGGETRPELQDIIFEDSYPARTENKQDFMECTEVTHATVRICY